MSMELKSTNDQQGIDASDRLLLNHYSRHRAPESFLELVRRHTSLVFGTCLRITANRHDAEELTQECFFDLARQAGEIRTSLVGWLHQAATHRALNRIRGERRRRTHEQHVVAERQLMSSDVAVAESTEVSWSDVEPLVDQALAELPEELRTPILMSYLEGTSQEDVANSLGLHQSTVSRRLKQGIDSLRESLRRAGLVVPAAALVTWFMSQSAVAAPPALASSLGKIAVAGVGTTVAAKAAGTGLLPWLLETARAMAAFLFVPLASGILWGEPVFLMALIAWWSYIGLRRPEWFRVLCYTRQFPNVYDNPLFPFGRWTWKAPPQDWWISTIGSLISGTMMLVVSATMLMGVPKPGWLLFLAAGLWNSYVGARIWRRVRWCRKEFPGYVAEPERPVDGAALFTSVLSAVMLVSILCTSSWLSTAPDESGNARLHFAGIAFIQLSLVCVTMLALTSVFLQFRRWCQQKTIDPAVSRLIDALAPPAWLLGLWVAIPSAILLLFTYVTLTHDVIPVYVPFGDDAIEVERRGVLTLTMVAMGCAVFATFPLAYLYRRIPNIAWGVACGFIALIGLLNLALFMQATIVTPVLATAPIYAPPPRLEPVAGHFVVENHPNLLANESIDRDVKKRSVAGSSSLEVRVAPGATVTVECDGHQASYSISKDRSRHHAEVSVLVMVSPRDFERGVPSQIQISLFVISVPSRKHELADFVLPLPAGLSMEEKTALIQLTELERERDYSCDQIVNMGTIMGKPVTLTVHPDATSKAALRATD